MQSTLADDTTNPYRSPNEPTLASDLSEDEIDNIVADIERRAKRLLWLLSFTPANTLARRFGVWFICRWRPVEWMLIEMRNQPEETEC